MKKLTLLRHAKSSWNDPGQDDFDRPLNERGHNPGLEMLAAMLADRDTAAERDLKRLQTKFPTAALAHFDCDINSWKEMKARSARLMALVTPKDL